MSELMPPRRIAFVTGSLRRGGAERVVVGLANHYAEQGWQVDILLLLFDRRGYDLHAGVRVIVMANEGRARWLALPSWLFQIRRYLRTNRPDVVLAFAARINIITALAGMGLPHRLVVSERNDPAADGRSGLVRWLAGVIYPRAARVVCQTRWAKSCFADNVQSNCVIIGNPVNVADWPLADDGPLVVAVGRLEPQKNHDLLLRAFKVVHAACPASRLKILGEGPLQADLLALSKELGLAGVVELPGDVVHIHEEMAQARVFVLSSDYEGLSNALLEALQLGLPCVSTACAGSNEVLKSGENGILVPVGDEAALAAALVELLQDEELRTRLSAAAKKTGENFRADTVLTAWDAVLVPPEWRNA